MNNKKIGIILFLIFLFLAFLLLIICMNVKSKINSNFASRIHIKYFYGEKKIEATINDNVEIETIKSILKGKKYVDHPSCGFSTDISLTLYNDNENITFCLARDGCPVFRINSSDEYIRVSKEQRCRIDEILEGYGVVFPCV